MTQKLIKEQIQFNFAFVCPITNSPILFQDSEPEIKEEFLSIFKLVYSDFKEEFSYLKHDFLRWSFINKKPICFDYQLYSIAPLQEKIINFDDLSILNITIDILNGSFNSTVEQNIYNLVVDSIVSLSHKHGSQLRFIRYDKYRKYEISDIGFKDF